MQPYLAVPEEAMGEWEWEAYSGVQGRRAALIEWYLAKKLRAPWILGSRGRDGGVAARAKEERQEAQRSVRTKTGEDRRGD